MFTWTLGYHWFDSTLNPADMTPLPYWFPDMTLQLGLSALT